MTKFYFCRIENYNIDAFQLKAKISSKLALTIFIFERVLSSKKRQSYQFFLKRQFVLGARTYTLSYARVLVLNGT